VSEDAKVFTNRVAFIPWVGVATFFVILAGVTGWGIVSFEGRGELLAVLVFLFGVSILSFALAARVMANHIPIAIRTSGTGITLVYFSGERQTESSRIVVRPFPLGAWVGFKAADRMVWVPTFNRHVVAWAMISAG